jgi:hypothetical protein
MNFTSTLLRTIKVKKAKKNLPKKLWGFGRIDVSTKDVFVVSVFGRNKKVLLLLIRKFVHPETTIYAGHSQKSGYKAWLC